MTSDSTTLLALVLERRFGAAWVQRWLAVEDEEVRWLAIYLAEEVSKGRECGQAAALGLIAEGRAWLPVTRRTARPVEMLLVALRTAELWPLARQIELLRGQVYLDGQECIPFL